MTILFPIHILQRIWLGFCEGCERVVQKTEQSELHIAAHEHTATLFCDNLQQIKRGTPIVGMIVHHFQIHEHQFRGAESTVESRKHRFELRAKLRSLRLLFQNSLQAISCFFQTFRLRNGAADRIQPVHHLIGSLLIERFYKIQRRRREIVERSIAAFDNAVASEGAIFDAVGSESVEAAADALEDYLRRQYARTGQVLVKRRFSPGYGDWALTAQKDIFNILPMDKIGVKLSPELIMAPEKSITAVIGIINPGDAKDNE